MASGGLTAYEALHAHEMDGEILQNNAGFTFIDFLPQILKSGFITHPVYENFRTLVDRANVFLRSNKNWKIITCESVEFKYKRGGIDPMKMTYFEHADDHTSYIRGLRLWLTDRNGEKEREQQIDYFNVIPRQLEKGSLFTEAKFETLESTIEKFNSTLKYSPLPGRIITIESQEMRTKKFSKLDPDRSEEWSVGGQHPVKKYVFVLRIFYELMDSSSEEIGVKDFIPDVISEGGIFSLPKYECFSDVAKKASVWCSRQRYLRFCNAQSLQIKVKRGNPFVNTQKMNYIEHSVATSYVRIFRIAYTKPYSVSEKPSPIMDFSCRTFAPVLLSTGILVPEYENLAVTKERVSAWVKATGAHVLSAETVAYRTRSSSGKKQGAEASFSYNKRDMNYHWMYVIRLYLNGVYKEPHPGMLPPMPELEKDSCHIS